MPTRLWPKEATTPRQSGPSSAVLPAKIVLDIETPLFWTNNFTTNLPPLTGSVAADGAVGHGQNAEAFDEIHLGPAADVLPSLVDEWLAELEQGS